MGSLISSFLPYLLFLFFVIYAFREPVYLLGIPFLMFLRSSIFFDNFKIVSIPPRLGFDGLLLCWLILVMLIFLNWSLFRPGYKQADYFIIKGVNLLDFIIICLMIMTIVNFFVVYGNYSNNEGILKEFFTLLSLFLGYFILKGIIRYVNPVTLTDFLFSIVVVNTIASFLYLLNQGLHIQIYTAAAEGEQEDFFEGQTVTRIFWFMPILWSLSIAYLIIFLKKRPITSIVFICINLLGIFLTYSRSIMLVAVFIMLLYSILIAYKKKDMRTLIRNLTIMGVASAVLFIAIMRFIPAGTKYFMDRFKQMQEAPIDDEETNTMAVRFVHTGEIIDQIGPDKELTGMGPVTEKQLYLVTDMDGATADMAWTGVVFRWGYIGLGLFILLYLVAMVKAFTLFMQAEGILSDLALLFLLILIWQVIESFFLLDFFQSQPIPDGFMVLWYFGCFSQV